MLSLSGALKNSTKLNRLVNSLLRLVIFLNVSLVYVDLLSTNEAYANTEPTDAEACFSRAEQYLAQANEYPNDERDPANLFDMAMENYLCAAKLGHASAMWRAVNLSGSGQVVALPREQEDRYLRKAAEAGLADAQIALGADYCDNIGTGLPCKNREEAEKWFIMAAQSGSVEGAFQLGILHERNQDDKYSAKYERALACFLLAKQRISLVMKSIGAEKSNQIMSDIERIEWGIERMKSKTGKKNVDVSCY